MRESAKGIAARGDIVVHLRNINCHQLTEIKYIYEWRQLLGKQRDDKNNIRDK